MQSTFDSWHLDPLLQRGLDQAGFETPTPVQQQVISKALAGHDLLVNAATGSGKTAAFLLPTMQRQVQTPSPRTATRALVLVPTRELAYQIRDHFLNLGSYTQLRIGVIIGGESRRHQIAILRKNPEWLVATPGRLLEHLRNGEAALDDLETLVLDEADRMLDLGFADEVLSIVQCCNPQRQTLLFSATLHHRRLEALIGSALHDPETVLVDRARGQAHPNINHRLLLSDHEAQKYQQLLHLLPTTATTQTLVFVNQRTRADHLGNALRADARRTGVLHGELDQAERRRIVGLFREGRIQVLVATDVAARGLDIPAVGQVIHFDLPRRGDDYLHRSGRTGRAKARGESIAMSCPAEFNRVESIGRYLGLEFERFTLPEFKVRFHGQLKKRSKSSRQPPPTASKDSTKPKPKNRWRVRKQIGKRRQPSNSVDTDAGWQPVKRHE